MRPSIKVTRKPPSSVSLQKKRKSGVSPDHGIEQSSPFKESSSKTIQHSQEIQSEIKHATLSDEPLLIDRPGDALVRRNRQLELIINFTRQFSETLDFNNLMETVFQRILEATNAEAGSFWIPDERSAENVCTIAEGPVKENVQNLRIKAGEGIVGWVIENRLNTTIFDASRDPRFSGNVDKKTSFVTKSMLCVPMTVQDECVGAIQVINKKGGNGQFNEEDLDILENLAVSAAIAIKNARLFDNEQKIKELNTVLNISKELNASLDLDHVLLSIVNLAAQAINYERAVIALLDNNDQVFIAAETNEVTPDLNVEDNIRLKTIFEHVASTGEPLHLTDYQSQNRKNTYPEFIYDYMDEYELKSLSVLVLADSEGRLGLLSMEGKSPLLINKNSQGIVDTLVNQSSIAIRNAQLYQNITSTSIADRFRSGFGISSKVKNRIKTAAIVAGIILLFSLIVPLPSNVKATVEIIPFHSAQVTARSEGVVKEVYFNDGDHIEKGDLLVQLDTALLVLERDKLRSDLSIQQSTLRHLERDGNPADIHLMQLEVRKGENNLLIAQQNLANASIKAPRSGIIVSPRPDDLLDKQVVKGESLADIAVKGRKMARLFISDKDLLLVEKGDKVTLVLQSLPGKVLPGELSEISHAKIEDEEGNKSYIGYFTGAVLDRSDEVRLGMSGSAKIHTGFKTLYLSSFKNMLVRIYTRFKLIFVH